MANTQNITRLLEGQINKNDNILVVGPSKSWRYDPIALIGADLVKKGEGNIAILDYRAPAIGIQGESFNEYGDLLKYKKEMQTFENKNILYALGSAYEIPFKKGSFHIIIDHCTLEWIKKRAYAEGLEENEKIRVKNTISEYDRILKQGGKLLLFLQTKERPKFKKELEKHDFKINEQMIDDKYKLLINKKETTFIPDYVARFVWIAEKS